MCFTGLGWIRNDNSVLLFYLANSSIINSSKLSNFFMTGQGTKRFKKGKVRSQKPNVSIKWSRVNLFFPDLDLKREILI